MHAVSERSAKKRIDTYDRYSEIRQGVARGINRVARLSRRLNFRLQAKYPASGIHKRRVAGPLLAQSLVYCITSRTFATVGSEVMNIGDRGDAQAADRRLERGDSSQT